MEKSDEIKILLLGESNVGKTSIANQFLNEISLSKYHPSQYPLNLPKKNIIFDEFQKEIKFSITDIAGQKEKRSLASCYYKDTNVFLLVYDLTNEKSLNEIISFWYKDTQSNPYFKNPIYFVVANKYDIRNDSLDLLEKGMKFASNIDAIFYSSSANDTNNIQILFYQIGLKYIYENNFFDSKIRDKFYSQINKSTKRIKTFNVFNFGFLKSKNDKNIDYNIELEKKCKNYLKIIDELNDKIRNYLTNISDLMKNKSDLKEEILNEKNKAYELNVKVQGLISQNFFNQKKITDLEKQLKDKEDELKVKEDGLKVKEVEIKVKEEEIKELQSKINSYENEIETLMGKIKYNNNKNTNK